jgi:hypothetical protein
VTDSSIVSGARNGTNSAQALVQSRMISGYVLRRRHFMYCELEDRLYRSRDAFSSALQEYDDTCVRHDAEMNDIRDALLAKFGNVPLLARYRQMAIRQQKARNWAAAIWWAERGLSLYGENAARPEALDDLDKRVAAYRAKLSNESKTMPRTPA